MLLRSIYIFKKLKSEWIFSLKKIITVPVVKEVEEKKKSSPSHSTSTPMLKRKVSSEAVAKVQTHSRLSSKPSAKVETKPKEGFQEKIIFGQKSAVKREDRSKREVKGKQAKVPNQETK